MTIAEYASELADQMRAQGVDGPALREALAVAVAMWMDIDALAGSNCDGAGRFKVATVADGLYAQRLFDEGCPKWSGMAVA